MNLKIKAYAKINLFLDITGRLPNGYHTLNTVMRQIDLYDELEIETPAPEGGIRVVCDNAAVPQDSRNIAYRAAQLFFERLGEPSGAKIGIKKNIPLEAGLGGSSADGAAVLLALNGAHGRPFTDEKLLEMGASLGADVPFCLYGGTAVCGGIGEKITPADCPDDHFIAIVKPDFSCSTAEAYRAYDSAPVPANGNFGGFAESLPYGAKSWSGGVYNVFEKLYADRRINALTRALCENGALASAMSGSGSAVFGIFEDKSAAESALDKIKAPFKTVTRAAAPEHLKFTEK